VSSGVSIRRYRTQSSSLMNNKNRAGPNTIPCGTTDVTSSDSDVLKSKIHPKIQL
jgi:hypothetical protein